MRKKRGVRLTLNRATALAVASLGSIGSAAAFEIPMGESDVKARWDNTIKYSTAYRLHNPSERIAGGDAGDDVSGGDEAIDGLTTGMDLVLNRACALPVSIY